MESRSSGIIDPILQEAKDCVRTLRRLPDVARADPRRPHSKKRRQKPPKTRVNVPEQRVAAVKYFVSMDDLLIIGASNLDDIEQLTSDE